MLVFFSSEKQLLNICILDTNYLILYNTTRYENKYVKEFASHIHVSE